MANIENTVIANYDLATGKSSHYDLLISQNGAESTVTVLPFGMSDNSPSIFKVSTCINRFAGTTKQGEFRFSAAETNKNDVRLSNIGYFVNEHNLRTWWIRLNDKQNLMFNEDVGGMMIANAGLFNNQLCPLD
ncbi:hypothetical protein [Citrobacter rodentium]|nr:hypothetical protein [Citrobacter rodentium]QBY31553.1 hypothetical protein E2R62_23865 [Citrobacter rodentium]UHO31091.1 hypothetical protein K7R23_24790 [Citrobacter rodentium NBRC 105723 = DSM 16636]HAT8014133.1 hypothetical protein [Citrobacter rodentium NBRC 105723 = DSM 16636]HAT8019070.1 hypothetical protein [Citrobacter rodentium]HAT8028727.1 hypothetical protein [Citrobacter rodentium]